MDIYTLIGLALATSIAAFTIGEYNKQAAINVSCAGGAVIMLSILADLSGILDEMEKLSQQGGLNSELVTVILKAVGIAYMVQFASNLCKDMGESALAVKTEIAGRVLLLSLAFPIIRDIAELLIELVGSSL